MPANHRIDAEVRLGERARVLRNATRSVGDAARRFDRRSEAFPLEIRGDEPRHAVVHDVADARPRRAYDGKAREHRLGDRDRHSFAARWENEQVERRAERRRIGTKTEEMHARFKVPFAHLAAQRRVERSVAGEYEMDVAAEMSDSGDREGVVLLVAETTGRVECKGLAWNPKRVADLVARHRRF